VIEDMEMRRAQCCYLSALTLELMGCSALIALDIDFGVDWKYAFVGKPTCGRFWNAWHCVVWCWRCGQHVHLLRITIQMAPSPLSVPSA